jgi:AraC-like DNA-binding protein
MILHNEMQRAFANAVERGVGGTDFGMPWVEQVCAVRNSSAARISWHQHDCFELLLVLEGSTSYELRGGAALELAGGQFVVIPPRERHRGKQDVRMPTHLCGVAFDPLQTGAARHTPFSRADLVWMAEEFQRHALVVQEMGPELRRLVGVLDRNVEAFDPGQKERAQLISMRLLVAAVLLEAAQQFNRLERLQPVDSVRRVLAYLEENFQEPLAVAELAAQAGCGRARFFQVFKAATGMTPTDYLQRLRIRKAQGLLETTLLSVTQIALETGFSTSQYFSSVFRRYAGTTPAEFRRRVASRFCGGRVSRK